MRPGALNMIRIDRTRTARISCPGSTGSSSCRRTKIRRIEDSWRPEHGAPVFTVDGRYTARGWTEWTAGLPVRLGAAAVRRDRRARVPRARPRAHARRAWRRTSRTSASTITASTTSAPTATLWRLAREGRIDGAEWERPVLRAGAAGERRRAGAALDDACPDGGYIHSFNGAHSLFVDTIRSLRALALAHLLGHRLIEEQDAQVNLLDAAACSTRARRPVQRLLRPGRDRSTCAAASRTRASSTSPTARYRGPSTQQGYSPFSTWTRGLAWAMLGFAEQLEFLATLPRTRSSKPCGGRDGVECDDARSRARDVRLLHRVGRGADGMPYWDTGAPGLSRRSATGAAAPPIRSTIASRWTARPRPSPRRGCCGSARFLRAARRRRRRAYEQAGLRVLDTLFDSGGPVPERGPGTPGPAAALRLSPAERLGPRAAGAHGSRAANRASGATTTRAKPRCT